MKRLLLVGVAALALFVSGSGSVLAQGDKGRGTEKQMTRQENVCNRIEEAWQARLKGYERAREVRKKAFERTLARWERLFTRLDGLGVDTKTVRADAAEVKTKFEALLAADDKFMEAKKQLAKAQCAKEGITEARKAVEKAQQNRREARKAYNAAMKQLHTDLAKLRPIKKDTKTESEDD